MAMKYRKSIVAMLVTLGLALLLGLFGYGLLMVPVYLD